MPKKLIRMMNVHSPTKIVLTAVNRMVAVLRKSISNDVM